MNKRILSLLSLCALLAGCSNKISLKFSPYEDFINPQELMRDYEDEYFVSKKEVTPISIKGGSISSLRDLYNNTKGVYSKNTIPTKGDRKLLVIPVYFTDSDTSNQDAKTIFIQNAFFGKTGSTSYDSLVGYYNKSSYGQLKISGEVAPWYNIGIKSSEWEKLSSSYMNASSIIVASAVDYLKEHSEINFDDYDTDKDGILDGVYAIYDHPQEDSSSFFWAYTHHTYKGENQLNKTEPYLNNYSWTSVNTLMQKDNKSSTNYIIHETGHLFGLSDYYNRSANSNQNNYHYQPTGYFDMMDYNIGDHSSFSKYLLNYSSPLVVKNNISTTIKLHPLSTSGEYLLISSSDYHNSPFAEYLLVEFFSPTGLNKFDGSFSYSSKTVEKGVYRYPNHYGVRIYHVNTALGYYQKGTNTSMICRVDDPNAMALIEGKTVGVEYVYDNTISDQEASNKHPVLYHLLESSGQNTFIDGNPATNDTLFKTGSDFGINTYKGFTFDNGSECHFQMKVVEMSTDYVKLEIKN